MRICVVHNRYQQAGGEDSVFENEVELLRASGAEVSTIDVTNNDIKGVRALAAAFSATYSRSGHELMAREIDRFQPDLVHVHNFFPLLSPAIFDACADAGVASVWTLHNYRVACANGLLFRADEPCEVCLGQSPLPAIKHRCYRGSLPASTSIAASIAWHNAAGTWRDKVDRFIALTPFAREIFVQAGLPRSKIAVKANCVQDPGQAIGQAERSGAIYVGRLSQEKGVRTMVDAWAKLHIPLTIFGEGPLEAELRAMAGAKVHFAGFQDRATILDALSRAQAIIVPSIWYENFPMTVVEANACGTPVIASRIGALESIVAEGRSGFLFTPGDSSDLGRVVSEAFAHPSRLQQMGRRARLDYEERSSPATNLQALLEIYRQAIATRSAR